MIRYIEAPAAYDGSGLSLFMAGGITGCPDWQTALAHRLAACVTKPLTLLNPRRENFPIHDPSAADQQIAWEHFCLRASSAVMFWFPAETLCPIVLYELGAWSMTPKKLFVATHPEYQRRADVVIQTRLARPEVPVDASLDELSARIINWVNHD